MSKENHNATNYQRIPKKMNDHSVPRDIWWKNVNDSMKWEEEKKIKDQNNIEYTKLQYEKMGIVVIEEHDDLFWNVILPDGWTITRNGYWSDIFDEHGRKRANFFYKGSFYDRDAFTNLNTRYCISVDHTADASSDYEIWKKSDFQGVVIDCGKVIYQTECIASTGDYRIDDKIKADLKAKLLKFMNENYPDFEDVHAYWD